MKESKQYRLNEVVFRQGDESVFMYRVLRGKVGLFLDYGSSDEVKLAELLENQIFGEMGLLDHVPRSATAVVLEEETELEAFTEEDASGFFEQNPESGMLLLMQMCSRGSFLQVPRPLVPRGGMSMSVIRFATRWMRKPLGIRKTTSCWQESRNTRRLTESGPQTAETAGEM